MYYTSCALIIFVAELSLVQNNNMKTTFSRYKLENHKPNMYYKDMNPIKHYGEQNGSYIIHEQSVAPEVSIRLSW